jgi:hypothetical protein
VVKISPKFERYLIDMKNLFILFVFCSFSPAVFAQATKNTNPAKVPVLNVKWGGLSQGKIDTIQFRRIVDSPLVVSDEKGNKYPITRFRINYIFLSTYQDSESQMTKNIQDLRVFDFYDTPILSEVWRSSIRDNAKKGDTVLINNVIVRLKNGKKVMAPEFRASIE